MMTLRPTPKTPLKIGTRGSPLALAQAYETRQRLMQAHDLPQDAFSIEVIQTTGDKIQNRALRDIGGKGLFTKEIEEALLDKRIDIAVHSMKDMPTLQPDGLALTCFLPREDVRDAFVSSQYQSITALPTGAVIGTSSLRRKAQLLHKRPDLHVIEFRGNLQTRLRKLEDNVAVASFLAMAGLNRLDIQKNVPCHAIPVELMLPAVAQGAIGIEQRQNDASVYDLLAPIAHLETMQSLQAERAFLTKLDGSCQTPIAALAVHHPNGLWLRGEILSLDGTRRYTGERYCAVSEAWQAGEDLAKSLLAQAGENFFASL